jgi:hypothetical protein
MVTLAREISIRIVSEFGSEEMRGVFPIRSGFRRWGACSDSTG